jgi:hypothetical protein
MENVEAALANVHSYIEAQQAHHPGQDDNDTKRPLADVTDHENIENSYTSYTNCDHSGHFPFPQGNTSSTVNEDVSMNFVFQYIEHYEEDLLFSVLSDVFFLCGGIAYVILSLADFEWPASTTSYEDYQGGDDDEQRRVWLRILDAVAPLIYVLNSVVDLEWANRVRNRYKVKKRIMELWDDQRSIATSNTHSLSFATGDTSIETPHPTCSLPWLYRVRKHTTHRRDLLAALTFGFAASLGFFAVLCGEERVGKALDMASTLVYILSALIVIYCKRTTPNAWPQMEDQNIMNDAERLEGVGDVLFLVGSLMDAVICGFPLEQPAIWELVSALLWLSNALLYLRGDYVVAFQGVDTADGRARLV